MGRITLTGIEVFAHHGVLPHERELGQPFVVDVVLDLDLDAAADSDDLADTLDYGRVATEVAEVVAGPPVRLLETLAGRIAERCLADERVAEVQVTVHKPRAPMPVPTRDVAVSLRRSRR